MKKCRPMRQLRPETGKSLAIFSKHWSNCICFIYFIFLTYCIKESIRRLFLDIKFKSVGLWDSYGLKQGNILQNLKINNQIVFVLFPDLLFYLMYQKGYQRWDILRLNEYVDLWGRYILKQGIHLIFFSKH